jgi:hypothetical protein
MVTDVDALKLKRDQLNARIQKAEARLKTDQKKADDRVKVLVGAALLDQLKQTGSIPSGGVNSLLALMDAFLSRPAERAAVLGEDNRGSAALHRLLGIKSPIGQKEE